jgi:hypothetical protein
VTRRADEEDELREEQREFREPNPCDSRSRPMLNVVSDSCAAKKCPLAAAMGDRPETP